MKSVSNTLAWVLGLVFLLVGVLGFVDNPLVGDGGYFHTNLAHNVVHLATGVLFVFAGMASGAAARGFMKVFGVVYLLVAILGFVMGGGEEHTMLLGVVGINAADNWLHVGLGVVIFALGFVGSEKKM